LGRFGQLGLGFLYLFGLGQRQRVIVVIRSLIRFEGDGLLVGVQSLIEGRLLVRACLRGSYSNVRIGEIGPNHVLVGIELGALFEGIHGRVVVLRGQRLLAGVKGIIQGLVLRHGGGVFLGLLLERVLLLLTHPALLFFGHRGGIGGRLRSGSLFQVEVNRNGIAQLGLNVLHLVLLLVLNEDADGVSADRKSIVDVMALLVGLSAFIGALHVLALDENRRVLDHLTVGAFDVPFNSGDLRPRSARRKQER